MNKEMKSESKFSTRSNLEMRTRGQKISGEQVAGIIMLIFAIGFNLWLYRAEPTATVDPNDNLFQYALVYRTNQIWDFAHKTCGGFIVSRVLCQVSYLVDHWVPNWNEGYNVPSYYSHIPQILIVGSWRFLSLFFIHSSLFNYYHLVIYLLLSLFPLSMFFALRVAGCSWLTAGFGALLASQLSTDGLYGLDPPSFLWRGYGLSSQLFAMVWLPLSIAYSYRKKILPAIVFLFLTTAGHLGIGIMAFLSLIPLLWRDPKKIIAIAVPTIILLSYWIVPAFLTDNFHNFSFWDPVWKFNSYGAPETITRLFNGDLFDFGRLPIFTALVLIGLFASLSNRVTELAFLLLFWLLLYFGRTTWGNLINLIPAMAEFHLSRFIVGIHIAGLFLAPIAIGWIIEKFKKIWFLPFFLLIPLIPVYQQTISYNKLNETLISRANENYAKQSPDMNLLVTTIQNLELSAPGRVYAGRGGGSWGKEFKLAETNMTMYLGNFAIPTVLWLPETWSPNGDTEQYFREDNKEDYDLFTIRYVATPATISGMPSIQPFWKLIKKNPSWNLYEVPTSGYFTSGVRPAIVAADKYSRSNVVRLWIQSDDPKNGLYPQLTFDTKNYPVNTGLPNFKMLDEVTYQVPDGSTHNIFAEPPRYLSDRSHLGNLIITDQTDDHDMVFTARVQVPEGCSECLVILKQTYHPNWRVTVDGKQIEPIITFPFYIGIPVTPGTHEIVAAYAPSRLKVLLIDATLLLGGLTIIWYLRKLNT